jgi:hypothetical protein
MKSFEINPQQNHGSQVFYVRWMRGTLMYDLSLHVLALQRTNEVDVNECGQANYLPGCDWNLHNYWASPNDNCPGGDPHTFGLVSLGRRKRKKNGLNQGRMWPWRQLHDPHPTKWPSKHGERSPAFRKCRFRNGSW